VGLSNSPKVPQTGWVKPGDHPEFFHFPPPEGSSRESTLRLDGEGRFFHEGSLVEHPKLAAALHTWIRRHPDDGRFILSNGYDWTYLTVEDAPFFVRHVHPDTGALWLELSDGTREAWDPARARIGKGGAIYTPVKDSTPGGPFEAKFTRYAQTELAPMLVEEDGQVAIQVDGEPKGRPVVIAPREGPPEKGPMD
jgi:uncharacterized protein